MNALTSRPFKLRFDFCTEGCSNVWQAHGDIVEQANIDGAEVWNVEYMGDAPNGWPMLDITFQCIETAKAYTCIYLGLGPIDKAWDVYVDDEVGEYISCGEFVG